MQLNFLRVPVMLEGKALKDDKDQTITKSKYMRYIIRDSDLGNVALLFFHSKPIDMGAAKEWEKKAETSFVRDAAVTMFRTTTAVAVHEDGEIFTGVSVCNCLEDNFVKSEGEERAKGRALAKLYHFRNLKPEQTLVSVGKAIVPIDHVKPDVILDQERDWNKADFMKLVHEVVDEASSIAVQEVIIRKVQK